jgi:hypothetical protein
MAETLFFFEGIITGCLGNIPGVAQQCDPPTVWHPCCDTAQYYGTVRVCRLRLDRIHATLDLPLSKQAVMSRGSIMDPTQA